MFNSFIFYFTFLEREVYTAFEPSLVIYFLFLLAFKLDDIYDIARSKKMRKILLFQTNNCSHLSKTRLLRQIDINSTKKEYQLALVIKTSLNRPCVSVYRI